MYLNYRILEKVLFLTYLKIKFFPTRKPFRTEKNLHFINLKIDIYFIINYHLSELN